MIYITVEIQTSSVALHYLGVMIWEYHIRELWEYFKLWKMTLNRAFMGWYWGCGKWPQIERMHQCLLIPTQRIYLVWNSFMILSFLILLLFQLLLFQKVLIGFEFFKFCDFWLFAIFKSFSQCHGRWNWKTKLN